MKNNFPKAFVCLVSAGILYTSCSSELTNKDYEGDSQFTSKFDYVEAGKAAYTEQEALGLNLFDDPEKGNCASCHPSKGDNGNPALFTDFSYANLGIPANPDNPFYLKYPEYMDQGLGGFLKTSGNPELISLAEGNLGKHMVPTLRNVDIRHQGFTKAYTHNGYFLSLKDLVHFYNTRNDGTWPAPEIADNVNKTEPGNPGLSDSEENAIVAFLKTLSDGYRIK